MLHADVDLRLDEPGAEATLRRSTVELEPLVAEVELRLMALGDALREREAAAIEQQAQALHQAMATALQRFIHAAHHGVVPEALRLRLSRTGAQLARQREALSRATSALDRAIDVLMPGASQDAQVYTASGMSPSRQGLGLGQGGLNA